MTKHTILFLAADPSGTSRRALDREARAIQAELKRSGHRDRFEFKTRWAAEPLDLLRELRELKPLIVHFSGRGDRSGLFFQAADGSAQLVSTAALAETFGAAGTSVRLVVLSACYREEHADALLAHVDHVVGVGGSIHEDTARSFAIGFYGGLGECEPGSAAYRQGCAAISLEGLPDDDRPQLKARDGISAAQPLLAEREPTAAVAVDGVAARIERRSDPHAPAPAPEAPERAIPKRRPRGWAIGIASLAAAAGLAVAVIATVLAGGHGGKPAIGEQSLEDGSAREEQARIDEIRRRLAGFGDPPPPAACAPTVAADAGKLILAARDKLATDAAGAIALAARAIERCPTWAAGHNMHGNALARADRLADAAASYARALTHAPDGLIAFHEAPLRFMNDALTDKLAESLENTRYWPNPWDEYVLIGAEPTWALHGVNSLLSTGPRSDQLRADEIRYYGGRATHQLLVTGAAPIDRFTIKLAVPFEPPLDWRLGWKDVFERYSKLAPEARRPMVSVLFGLHDLMHEELPLTGYAVQLTRGAVRLVKITGASPRDPLQRDQLQPDQLIAEWPVDLGTSNRLAMSVALDGRLVTVEVNGKSWSTKAPADANGFLGLGFDGTGYAAVEGLQIARP